MKSDVNETDPSGNTECNSFLVQVELLLEINFKLLLLHLSNIFVSCTARDYSHCLGLLQLRILNVYVRLVLRKEDTKSTFKSIRNGVLAFCLTALKRKTRLFRI